MGNRIATKPEKPQDDQQIVLDGVVYVLVFTWRTRTASWYADLSLLDGTPIFRGTRLSPNWSFTFAQLDGGVPGMAITRGVDTFIRESLGTDDLAPIYYPSAEIDEAAPEEVPGPVFEVA
jgi:hypothetical protein